MDLLESDKLKIKILKCLLKNRDGISLNGLKREAKAANFRSIKRNCDFLEIAGLITMEGFLKVERKKINSQQYRLIKITSEGKSLLNKI